MQAFMAALDGITTTAKQFVTPLRANGVVYRVMALVFAGQVRE